MVLIFSDTHKISVWIGLTNPSEKLCVNKACEGILKWADGSDYLYNSNWLNNPLPVESRDSDKCFYFDGEENAIRQGNCDQILVAMCQTSFKCPSKFNFG